MPAPMRRPRAGRLRAGRAGAEAQAASAARPAGAAAPPPSWPAALAAAAPHLSPAAGLMSAAIIIAALYYGRDFLVPLALAFLLGFVLDPLVVRLKRMRRAAHGGGRRGRRRRARRRSPSPASSWPTRCARLSAQLPIYQTNIQDKLRDFRERLDGPACSTAPSRTLGTVKKEVEEAAAKPAPPDARRRRAAARRSCREAAVADRQGRRWLEAGGGPLATAGIVLVFLVLVLLDRQDLRDRLLRLLGGNLHRTTDAMDEAGARISKYLTMQLVVNASYGLPMAAGLWLIGVPGAVLWGALAAVMRFVPYVGPMISAVFPLALAFAVDPGWNMLLWTVGLIVLLELVSNNLVEPWLYGASTGLSAMSLMVSATFWTLLWGPIGLVMSTPLTVCLLVVGRHLPHLRFFDVLLGSQPALDPPTRIYQRLLAGDVEEAIELAAERTEADGVGRLLRPGRHPGAAHGEQRPRARVDRRAPPPRRQRHGPPDRRAARAAPGAGRRRAAARGLPRRQVGNRHARRAHAGARAVALSGIAAEHRAGRHVERADFFAALDLLGALDRVPVALQPRAADARRATCAATCAGAGPTCTSCSRSGMRRADLLDEAAARALGADAVATSFDEAMLRVGHQLGAQLAEATCRRRCPRTTSSAARAARQRRVRRRRCAGSSTSAPSAPPTSSTCRSRWSR